VMEDQQQVQIDIVQFHDGSNIPGSDRIHSRDAISLY
jgi:hypothetical protein